MNGAEFPAVYCAKIPFEFKSSDIQPKQRAAEISAARCEKVRTQKFFAWKLLEYALAERFDLKIGSVEADIVRGEEGKWFCRGRDDCFFSLSHTDGAVAAAVSQRPCGVDIERFNEKRFLSERLAERILSAAEKSEYAALLSDFKKNPCGKSAAEKKSSYAALKWTQKESIFKMRGGDVFVPSKTDTLKCKDLFLQTKLFEICTKSEAEEKANADGTKAKSAAEDKFFLTVCGEAFYGEKPKAEFFVYGNGKLYDI